MKKIILFSYLFCSPALLANIYYDSDWNRNTPAEWHITPTFSYETNSLGNISNLGLKWGGSAQTNRNFELVTNLSFFTSDDPFNRDTSFTNLDTSIRFGLFDPINLYGELGIALDELFTDGFESDYYYHDYYYQDHYPNHYRDKSRPDWFVGLGGGWRMDWLTLNFYARYRYLESLEEQYLRQMTDRYPEIPNRYQWFTGIELSIHF